MATVLGPCGVIPREYPNIKCFNIDLPDSQPFESLPDEWLARIISEYAEEPASRVIAYRGKYRWERHFEPVKLNEPLPSRAPSEAPVISRLRPGGVYLITGGTGGLGLAIAGYLAKACRPRLVLTKKSPFPKKSSWPELVTAADTPTPVLKTITALMEIERMGAEIEVLVADVSDREQMQTAVDDVLTRYGTINGVIHAAGVVQAGMIQTKTRESADAVLAPKVYGTMILFDLLKTDQTGFHGFVLLRQLGSYTVLAVRLHCCQLISRCFCVLCQCERILSCPQHQLVGLERSGHVSRVGDPAGGGGSEAGCPRKRNHDKRRFGGLPSSPKFKSHAGYRQPAES